MDAVAYFKVRQTNKFNWRRDLKDFDYNLIGKRKVDWTLKFRNMTDKFQIKDEHGYYHNSLLGQLEYARDVSMHFTEGNDLGWVCIFI